VQGDPDHEACRSLFLAHSDRLLTTNSVFDELCTLFRARGSREIADRFCPDLLSGAICRLHWVTEDDFLSAWSIYCRFTDKDWSFTDCTSYAVMQRLGITETLALDDHFRQFGIAMVKP
jgi:predicted nucleic acid-binding protein